MSKVRLELINGGHSNFVYLHVQGDNFSFEKEDQYDVEVKGLYARIIYLITSGADLEQANRLLKDATQGKFVCKGQDPLVLLATLNLEGELEPLSLEEFIRRLVEYLSRPDMLANETLDSIFRKLDEGEQKFFLKMVSRCYSDVTCWRLARWFELDY